MTEIKGFSHGGFRPHSTKCHGRVARHRGSARPNCSKCIDSETVTSQRAVVGSASNALPPTTLVVGFRAVQL